VLTNVNTTHRVDAIAADDDDVTIPPMASGLATRLADPCAPETVERIVPLAIAPIEDRQTSPAMSPNFAEHITNQARITNIRGAGASGKQATGEVIHLPRPAERLEAPPMQPAISRLDGGRVSIKRAMGALGWGPATELVTWVTLQHEVVVRAFDKTNQHPSQIPVRLDSAFRMLLPPAVLSTLRLRANAEVMVVALPETKEVRIANAATFIAGGSRPDARARAGRCRRPQIRGWSATRMESTNPLTPEGN
jgi:hypothetical protein